MNLFNPSRDQVRRFFIDAWRKHLDAGVLTSLATLGLAVTLGGGG